MTGMEANQPKGTVRGLYPFDTKAYWIAWLIMTSLWAIWLLVDFRSFEIVNGIIAGPGAAFVLLLAGVRQTSWQVILLAIGYATFVCWMSRSLWWPMLSGS
jgi:hypothetical protein